MRHTLAILAACAVAAAPAFAALDGSALHSKFAGDSLAIQTNATGYGDNYSELDQLFGAASPTAIHLGVAGNMEGNGNSVVILFDTVAGGSSVLNAPGTAIAGHNGALTFDDAFQPDYGLALNNSGGTLYSDFADFVGGTTAFIGQAPVGGGAGGSDPGIQFALDNSNTAGVTGSDAAGADSADTGLELLIDPAKIGLPAGWSSLKMLVYLQNQNGQYLSNQFLPGLPLGTSNVDNRPIDLRQYPGAHFVTLRNPGTPVPEPATLSLLAFGLLPFLRRKR